MAKAPRITLYSAPGCPHCRQAAEFLRKHGVAFQELNVRASPKALKQLERLGARGVPVILVGEKRLDGFNGPKLKQMLVAAGIQLG